MGLHTPQFKVLHPKIMPHCLHTYTPLPLLQGVNLVTKLLTVEVITCATTATSPQGMVLVSLVETPQKLTEYGPVLFLLA